MCFIFVKNLVLRLVLSNSQLKSFTLNLRTNDRLGYPVRRHLRSETVIQDVDPRTSHGRMLLQKYEINLQNRKNMRLDRKITSRVKVMRL